MITFWEVAKVAGVSVNTVSRVINDMPDVNFDIKKNVTPRQTHSKIYIPNNIFNKNLYIYSYFTNVFSRQISALE